MYDKNDAVPLLFDLDTTPRALPYLQHLMDAYKTDNIAKLWAKILIMFLFGPSNQLQLQDTFRDTLVRTDNASEAILKPVATSIKTGLFISLREGDDDKRFNIHAHLQLCLTKAERNKIMQLLQQRFDAFVGRSDKLVKFDPTPQIRLNGKDYTCTSETSFELTVNAGGGWRLYSSGGPPSELPVYKHQLFALYQEWYPPVKVNEDYANASFSDFKAKYAPFDKNSKVEIEDIISDQNKRLVAFSGDKSISNNKQQSAALRNAFNQTSLIQGRVRVRKGFYEEGLRQTSPTVKNIVRAVCKKQQSQGTHKHQGNWPSFSARCIAPGERLNGSSSFQFEDADTRAKCVTERGTALKTLVVIMFYCWGCKNAAQWLFWVITK